MLNIIRKSNLYRQVLYKGELLKRIEYKIKDFIGYFYFRTKMQERKARASCDMYDTRIDYSFIDIKNDDRIDKEEYRIFNNIYHYQELKKYLAVEEEFWRKVKLNKYEDIKIVWEYNRLQVLLPLTIKYLKTKNVTYKDTVEEILENWEENNKFEYTLNWNNNLEVAIRSINIGLSLILLQDRKLNEKYSKLLYLHAMHINSEIEYSNKCIPNNHVIGEATALLFLARILNTKESKKWCEKSIKILMKYLDMINDEGVSIENSFSYQFFVTKMYIFSLCFIEDKEIFNKINQKVLKSLNTLKYVIIDNDTILNYGDNDNGFLYSIYMDYNIAKDIEEYYNLFFKNEINNETNIYIELLKVYNPYNKIKMGTQYKKEYLFTKNIFIYKWEDNLLFFNAKPIEWHAHNDSLSINLVINGEEVLLDAGTYSYNISKEKRNYYRGRESHNTIQIENNCNALAVTSFRWINKNNSYLEILGDNEEYIEIEGIIEEICTRKIRIYKKDKKIEVEDSNITNSILENHWICKKGRIVNDDTIEIENVNLEFDKDISIIAELANISRTYLEEESAQLYKVKKKNDKMNITINWKNNE